VITAVKMPKASDADKNRFRDLVETVAHIPGVEVKPMFGQLGAFVNGNMFAGLFGSSIGVKLDEEGTTQLRHLGGGPFGPDERPMGGYTTIPDTLEPQAWVERSAAYVGTLPPKSRKK
jgi:TfoX/Sxy family transcriptional regulator of competence genes